MTKQFQRSKILGTSISNTRIRNIFIEPSSDYDIVLMMNDYDGRKITSLNLIPQHECQINFIKYHLTGNCPIRACSSMSIYHQANTIPGETIKRINDTHGEEVRRGIR